MDDVGLIVFYNYKWYHLLNRNVLTFPSVFMASSVRFWIFLFRLALSVTSSAHILLSVRLSIWPSAYIYFLVALHLTYLSTCA